MRAKAFEDVNKWWVFKGRTSSTSPLVWWVEPPLDSSGAVDSGKRFATHAEATAYVVEHLPK